MKKIILLAFWCSLCLNPTFSQSLTELVKQSEKAIFSIFTYDEYGVPNGTGTGFFIDNTGTAVSNYHVLKDASTAVVKFIDGSIFDIENIISASPEKDLIKFKVASTSNSFLTISYQSAQKGDDIFVIGNPEGFESTVSEGIISSLRELDDFGKVVQITAPISPGSSGSPVMNMKGQVIGIATFQYKEGQNLNFAVDASNLQNLTPISSYSQAIKSNPNLVIINERCEDNSELILNSIEFKPNEAILNFSFTNVSIGYGEYMLIWSTLRTKDETFFIQDLTTLEKYYATSSTIGNSRENGTKVALGETKRFRITFPPIPKNVNKINILEGLSSSWNFLGLDLDKYRRNNGKDLEEYEKDLALTKLETKDYESATVLLKKSIEIHGNNDDTYNVLGIISYVIDNNYDALNYFSKAIEVNPRNDIYYFNRFRVYYEGKKDMDNALNDITLAIKNRPNQGDYYQHRAYVYMAKENFDKAIKDLDIAINQMGEHYFLYRLRGSCKAYLRDAEGACSDMRKAFELSKNTDTEVRDWLKNNCR